MRTTRATALLVTTLALLGAACGGGGDSDGDDIASLGGDVTTTTTDDGGGNGARRANPEFQDAMLEYAQCMRDEGVDMPDPQFDGEGGAAVIIGGPGGPNEAPPSDAEIEAFEAADEKCQPILEDVVGDFEPPSPEEQARMQEEALEFAQCMREHGIDMPDPQFDEDGRGGIAIGRDDGGGPGGGFDPRDEEFQEAAEECGQDGGFGVFSAGGSETDTGDSDDEGDD